MNPVQIIAALRKLGNYMAGIFPALVVIADWFGSRARKLAASPFVSPLRERAVSSPYCQTLWKVIERFYWRNYSKDRLDLNEAPPDCLPILRPIFQMCVFLCLLIPLAQFPIAPVNIELFSGFKGSMSSLSVLLCMICLPCAWAALLIGSAVSNRLVFSATALSCLYFMSTCVIQLPRSYFNIFLPAGVLLGLCFCERSRRASGGRDRIAGMALSLLVGGAAGIQAFLFSPLKPLLQQSFNLAGPLIGIGGGAVLGVILGTLCYAWANISNDDNRPLFLRGGAIEMDKTMWSIAASQMIFLLAGIQRGDLSQSAGLLISSLTLSNNYLWPMWYFIGVGILHKLMKSSKTISQSIEGVLPAKWMVPAMVLALIASLIVVSTENVTLFLSRCSGTFAEGLFYASLQVLNATKPWIWNNPLNVMSTHWFTWVLVFDAAAVLFLAIQRRLTSQALARLFFLTCLAALLIWEYVFQISSFMRGPINSAVLLFFFSVSILWLMHTVGWGICQRSSPLFPSRGRLALFAGITMLSILEIYARTSAKDFAMSNELFLSMYRGIIDVGLPYFFFIWASRRVKQMSAKPMLGLFVCGALTSFLFNMIDKLFAAGSLSGLWQIAIKQAELLRSAGNTIIDLTVPHECFVVKALLYVFFLVVLYGFCLRRAGDSKSASLNYLFLSVAFASGMASFSKTLVELPLPAEVRALLAPISQETVFNCNVFRSYLSYWFPAFILALSQLNMSNAKRWLFLAAIPLAVASKLIISDLYTEHEVYWRASGSFYFIMAITAGIFVILVAATIKLLQAFDAELESSAGQKVKISLDFLSPEWIVVLVAVAECALLPCALAKNLPLQQVNAAASGHSITIPYGWQWQRDNLPADGTPTASIFQRKSQDGISMLLVGTLPSHSDGTAALLKKLLMDAAQNKSLQNLRVIEVQNWNKYQPGALTCMYNFELPQKGSVPLTMSGLTVLLPSSGQSRTEYYTIYTSPAEMSRAQWEMALTVTNLCKLPTKSSH